MTYIKATRTGKWYVGGENATAECLQVDECDWEMLTYTTVRKAQLAAEDHVVQTGHPVQVERAQFRVVERLR